MPRKSSVRQLPPAIRAQIDQLLSSGRHSLDDILAHLRKLGADAPSRSALGRYAQDFEKVAARLRQSREMTRALVQELGPDSVEGGQGRLLIESMRTLVFEVMNARLAAEDGKSDVREIAALAKSARDLAQAMRMEQDFAQRIKEEARAAMSAEIKERIKGMGSAADLKALSDVELEQRILELAHG